MSVHIPTNFMPLSGHVSFETGFEVKDYPYGGLRTSMRYWIETKPKHGQRLVMRSLNPKTGGWNKPHAGTYSEVICLYINLDNSHCEHSALGLWNSKKELELFETAFAVALTDEQKKHIKMLHAFNQAKSPKSYFGLDEEQGARLEAGIKQIWVDFPDRDNPEQKAARQAARKILIDSIVNQVAAG